MAGQHREKATGRYRCCRCFIKLLGHPHVDATAEEVDAFDLIMGMRLDGMATRDFETNHLGTGFQIARDQGELCTVGLNQHLRIWLPFGAIRFLQHGLAIGKRRAQGERASDECKFHDWNPANCAGRGRTARRTLDRHLVSSGRCMADQRALADARALVGLATTAHPRAAGPQRKCRD
jgi:hypothetical protein